MYGGPTQRPANLTGNLRLAQRKVKVTVEGSDRVGVAIFDQPGAMMLIHELHLSRLIENTRKLLELTRGK